MQPTYRLHSLIITAVLVLPARLPAQTAGPDSASVELSLLRNDGGAGDALVSSGIPLVPGTLKAAALNRVRITIDGRERPAFVAALNGTHQDGSLISILVQFHAEVAAKGAEARLEIGVRRTLPPLPEQPAGAAQAIALPASADYLVATGIVGPTITTKQGTELGGAFREYEQKAAQFANDHWQQDGFDWSRANYYDRAFGHYALWVRTGGPTYWRWATRLAVDYRTNYLEHYHYGSSPRWAQLEGVALHYWLTGDERSRTAVIETAKKLTGSFPAEKGADAEYQYNEGRIQQRVMMACLLAWSLADRSRDWGAMADAYAENWLRLQRPDGSFRYRLSTEDARSPLGQSNFMEGLRIDALVKYYERRRADPRIISAIRRQVDYLWTTQWRPGTSGFQYWNVVRSDVAPDLNMLLVLGFGFTYRHTGIESYREWGDQIFAAGVARTYYRGSKQYNEQQYDSFNYLAYRERSDSARAGAAGR